MGWSRQLPRSFWPLITAAVVALATFWWLAKRGGDDPTVGLLVPWQPATITAVELVRADGRYVLSRTGDEWQLDGEVTDWVADDAVTEFLRGVTLGDGGDTLPGTEVRDRRYGFGGPEAVSLVVSATGDRRLVIDFGAVNPVSGLRYASSSNRRGVFAVTDPYRSLMSRMPDLIRLKTLLPPFARSDVDTIWIDRVAADRLLLVRRGQDWWLREPETGLAGFGTQVRLYHTHYHDRIRHEGNTRWLLAARRRLSNLIYEVSETALVGFGPPEPTAAVLSDVGLAPPYRAVTLRVSGFAERLHVQFGEVDPAIGHVHAIRQGSVVITHATALRTLELAGGEFVHVGALSFALADADSYCVSGAAGRPLVCARRGDDGRWSAAAPSGYRVRSSREQADNLVGDLVTDLDRLLFERVLPPVEQWARTSDRELPADSAPLMAEPQLVLTAWFDGDGPRRVVFGRLDSPWPITPSTTHEQRPAAAGTPVIIDTDDGKLLTIGEQTLITFRALRDFLEHE